MITRSDVDRDRTSYRLVQGRGYHSAPKLSMPEVGLAEASACEPVDGTEDKTTHLLLPWVERQAPAMEFMWHADTREWEPLGRNGKRVAFTSAYLAAHGWTYVRPA